MDTGFNKKEISLFLEDGFILLSKLAIDKDNAKIRLYRNGVEMLMLLRRFEIPKTFIRANKLKSSIKKKLTKNEALKIEGILYSNQILESLSRVHLSTCSNIIKDFYELHCDIRDNCDWINQ